MFRVAVISMLYGGELDGVGYSDPATLKFLLDVLSWVKFLN